VNACDCCVKVKSAGHGAIVGRVLALVARATRFTQPEGAPSIIGSHCRLEELPRK
jgi:hypothetical protein